MTTSGDTSVWEGFPKSQLLRTVMQLLLDMGYSDTVKTLERESSCTYQCPRVTELEEAVRAGNMKSARNILSQLKLPPEIRMACSFLCSQQDFAMALHRQDFDEALRVLRDDLCPSAFDEDTQRRVQTCASLLAYPSPEEALRSEIRWEASNSLGDLWMRLQHLISPELCVPPNRLLTLLRQAVELQELYCPHHAISVDDPAPPSLYEDHACVEVAPPSQCITRLEGHTDEVWDVALSPNGRYILTGGKDESVILWNASEPFERIHQWNDHQAVVNGVCWSSDSELCASIDKDGVILLWSPQYAWCIGGVEPSDGVQQCACWIPGRHAFLASSVERQVVLYEVEKPSTTASASTADSCASGESSMESSDSTELRYTVRAARRCRVDCRIRTIAVNKDGTLAIGASPDRLTHIIDISTLRELPPLPEHANVTVVVCSALYNQVLLSVAGRYPVMRLWDIDERRVIQTYRGHREDRFILRCAFGGPDERFVVNGSEDAQIYIWNKLFGTLVAVLQAHSSTVNAIAWSTRPGGYLFSVSDDHTVAVWNPLPKI
ncbi:WD G-beta repeat containing protein [Babesia ovata]|uniref:WD G-beta repeat containing protein n=1 Tax=Babesia ovata TaxID=189622 RepID=A0A2H6KF56_9APIC|nr:WD G-beta repeat containing protein [Babesia ovata]GBE61604.1 WD G-beta repeat containing protein [Babesia ovata]